MSKHEWRTKEKELYLPKNTPELVAVPEHQFITIKGEGSPYAQIFSERIAVLYLLTYAIKMNLKKTPNPPIGYNDYVVYPLEGIWDISEEAKKTFDGTIRLDDLAYTLMIRQPDFVDESFYMQMHELVTKKKDNELIAQIQFEKIHDGRCVQMLHIGSYENEHISFAEMEEFAKQQNLSRASKLHREIYLSDFRKVAKEKLRTVLRFSVA